MDSPSGSHLPSPTPAPKLRAYRSSSPQKAPPRCTSGQRGPAASCGLDTSTASSHLGLPLPPVPGLGLWSPGGASWACQPQTRRGRGQRNRTSPCPTRQGGLSQRHSPRLPSRPPAAHALCPNPGLSYCTAAMEPSQVGASLTSSQDGFLKRVPVCPLGPAKEDQEGGAVFPQAQPPRPKP